MKRNLLLPLAAVVLGVTATPESGVGREEQTFMARAALRYTIS